MMLEDRFRVEFARYINKLGLNQYESESFGNYLLKLFKRTSDIWKPGFCHDVPGDTSSAIECLRYFPEFLGIKPQRRGNGRIDVHYFWILKTQSNKELIIDPTGVPIWRDGIRKIEPYFGLPDLAPEDHKIRAYNDRTDFDWQSPSFVVGGSFRP